MPQQITFRLNQLRCIAESDTSGGSEPYLWVTYFVVDGRNIGQAEPVHTNTPVFNDFRREVPNNIRPGQVVNVPPFLASFTSQIDPGPVNFQLAGCVAVLLEEDETPDRAIFAGRNAYAAGIREQLNNLIKERIRTVDRGPVTEAEVKAIRDAIEPRIKSAIRAKLTLGEKLFDNQDDLLGFAHVAFIGNDIITRDFVFPELAESNGKNRFVLNGSLTVGPVPPPPFDPCKSQRAALQKERDELKGLQLRRSLLQQELQTASPGQKAAIIDQINALAPQIEQAEAEVRLAEAALKKCEESPQGSISGVGGVGVLNPR